jgi:hypothetical protein
MPMQSLADPTPLLGVEVLLDLVVSQHIQPLVEKVVMLMQSSTDPTPLLGGEVPLDHVVLQPIQPLVAKWSCQCSHQMIPLFFWGVTSLPTMFLAFLVQYFQNKGAFRSFQAHPLQALGWFPLIGMILLSLVFLLPHLFK